MYPQYYDSVLIGGTTLGYGIMGGMIGGDLGGAFGVSFGAISSMMIINSQQVSIYSIFSAITI